MPLDIEIRDQDDLTTVTVTWKLDVETCYKLSGVFMELGAALSAAQTRQKARRRFLADEPCRLAARDSRRAAIASRMAELKDLPPRKAVSVIAREFSLSWDTVDLACIEIRRAERRKAALRRDEEVLQLSKSGQTANAIAERLNLATGTVRNILTRIRKETSRPAGVKALGA